MPRRSSATLVDDLDAPAAERAAAYRCGRPCRPRPPIEVPHGGIDIDLAMLIYTSGSTGFPKGVMMTHQNIVAAATSITTYLENTSDDIIVSALPLSFDYGLYQVLMAAKLGATVVLEKSFAYPAAVLQKMRRERATGFPLGADHGRSPAPDEGAGAGQLPPPAVHHQYRGRAAAGTHRPAAGAVSHHADLLDVRAHRVQTLYLPAAGSSSRPGRARSGRRSPTPRSTWSTIAASALGPGEIGELVIRGGHVMKGYWEDPEATDRALRTGPYPWEKVLYSGDLFRADEEGYLYFVGRKDDIIKTRGEKVSPKEVENTLYALGGVREAAVIGVPDPILGMAIKAVIAPTEPGALTERDVLAHCARHLEDFMVPKAVEFVSELPKTDSGKIRRSQVQSEALEARAHECRRPED